MNVGAVVTTIAWIVVIVVIGIAVMRATRGQAFPRDVGLIIGSIAVALLATLVGTSLVFVQPTDRGVVISALDKGIRPVALQPGLNFVAPLLENVLHYPVTRQTYTMSIAPQEGRVSSNLTTHRPKYSAVGFVIRVLRLSGDVELVVPVSLIETRAYLY